MSLTDAVRGLECGEERIGIAEYVWEGIMRAAGRVVEGVSRAAGATL
jgi:hypothetical protein